MHSTAVATANEETFRAKLERAHTWEGALGFAAPRNWAQDRIEAAQGKPPFERAAIATGSFVTALVWGIGLIYYWLIGWAVSARSEADREGRRARANRLTRRRDGLGLDRDVSNNKGED